MSKKHFFLTFLIIILIPISHLPLRGNPLYLKAVFRAFRGPSGNGSYALLTKKQQQLTSSVGVVSAGRWRER
jgi:hypothetical protein